MSAPHWLGAADRFLFREINQAWTNRVLDAIMPVLTDLDRSRVFLGLALPGVLLAWLWRQRARAARVILALGLVVGATDLLCHRALKPLVHRARPERAGVGAVLRAGSHGVYGFPSNHAANMFAGAAFLSPLYPSLSVAFFAGAAVIAYSRVYVGAHFPLDVVGGGLVGMILGFAGAWAFRRLEGSRAPPGQGAARAERSR